MDLSIIKYQYMKQFLWINWCIMFIIYAASFHNTEMLGFTPKKDTTHISPDLYSPVSL